MNRHRVKKREYNILNLLRPFFNDRFGYSLQIIDEPDVSERNNQAIDFVCDGGGSIYLIEHTFIESYEGRKRSDAHFKELLAPLEKRLYKRLGTDRYRFQTNQV